ncbi:MAG TPA: DinB family protein [Terriglobales bacterium]
MSETAQQYTQRLLNHVSNEDPLKVQAETAKKLAKLIKPLSRKQLTQRPEPGKWSIAEILAHLADGEIVAGWRLRLIAGRDGVPVQAYNQDAWAEVFDYAGRDPKVSLETFRLLRENNLRMLKALPKRVWENYGMHEERGKETLAHLVRMFAGHDRNHVAQVEKIAKAKKTGKARKAA